MLATSTRSAPVEPGADFFESIYAEAHGDASRIRWAYQQPNPALVNWLNAVAPSLVRCGARACVAGCGLGDDAQALIKRGYDVTAFDISPTAIEWARRRDPENARSYVPADLFSTPAKWRHRFDLVVEIYTIQSLPPELHEPAMRSLAEIVSPRGHMLVIARVADESQNNESGPPWPLTEEEFRHLASAADLRIHDCAIFEDEGDPPVMRLRALLGKN